MNERFWRIYDMPMSSSDQPGTPGSGPQAPATEHLSSAHELLTALQKRIGEHPELAEAILKVETALNILTMKTGGML